MPFQIGRNGTDPQAGAPPFLYRTGPFRPKAKLQGVDVAPQGRQGAAAMQVPVATVRLVGNEPLRERSGTFRQRPPRIHSPGGLALPMPQPPVEPTADVTNHAGAVRCARQKPLHAGGAERTDHDAGLRAGKAGVGVQEQAGVVDQTRMAQGFGGGPRLVCDHRLEIRALQLGQFEVRFAERNLHARQDLCQRTVLARIARQQKHGMASSINSLAC